MLAQRTGHSQFSLDIRRLRVTDPLVGLAGLVVAGSLFTPWFGVPSVGQDSAGKDSAGTVSTTFSGITVHGYLIIAMLAALALIGVMVLRIGWDPPWIKLRDLLLLGTGTQLAFVLVAFLIRPVGLTWQSGAYTSLAAAVVGCGLAAIPDRRPAPGADRAAALQFVHDGRGFTGRRRRERRARRAVAGIARGQGPGHRRAAGGGG